MFSRWEGIVKGLSTFVFYHYLLQWGRTFHIRYGKRMVAFEIVQGVQKNDIFRNASCKGSICL